MQKFDLNNCSLDKLRKIKDVTSDYLRDLELEVKNTKDRIKLIQERIEHISKKD